MVVTIFSQLYPEALTQFLDLTHQFSFRNCHPAGSRYRDFAVVRSLKYVSCGYVSRGDWVVKHRYRIRDGPRGPWVPDKLFKKTPVGVREVLNAEHDRTCLRRMARKGRRFALRVLRRREWETEEGGRLNIRHNTSWRKDGERAEERTHRRHS